MEAFDRRVGPARQWENYLGAPLGSCAELALIDKDDILERLFKSRGTGDAAWRRALGRDSDVLLAQAAAAALDGAVLVSFWRQLGMMADSGTPTECLSAFSDRVVHVQCVCDVEVAAARFAQRTRHPGHLDSSTPYEVILGSLQELSRLGPVEIQPRIDVETSRSLNVDDIVRDIRDAYCRLRL